MLLRLAVTAQLILFLYLKIVVGAIVIDNSRPTRHLFFGGLIQALLQWCDLRGKHTKKIVYVIQRKIGGINKVIEHLPCGTF